MRAGLEVGGGLQAEGGRAMFTRVSRIIRYKKYTSSYSSHSISGLGVCSFGQDL